MTELTRGWSLALYGRSKNAYYREHSGNFQLPYRLWKCKLLSNLDFKIRSTGDCPSLVSPSNPIYTNLYNAFYKDKIKVITKENLTLLNHPIGLACLYMDDGTLVIESSFKNNKLYLFPRISLYTLSFTKEENIILRDYIKQTFDIDFKLKNNPYGKKFILEINKRNEIMKFINLVKPYVDEIDSMKYKVNIDKATNKKYNEMLNSYSSKDIIISPLQIEDNKYSKKDENIIIQLKNQGVKDKDIAEALGRSYYGVVDKMRILRKEGKFKNLT